MLEWRTNQWRENWPKNCEKNKVHSLVVKAGIGKAAAGQAIPSLRAGWEPVLNNPSLAQAPVTKACTRETPTDLLDFPYVKTWAIVSAFSLWAHQHVCTKGKTKRKCTFSHTYICSYIVSPRLCRPHDFSRMKQEATAGPHPWKIWPVL